MIETMFAVTGLIVLGSLLVHNGFGIIDIVDKRLLGLTFLVLGSAMFALALIAGVQGAVIHVLELKELI